MEADTVANLVRQYAESPTVNLEERLRSVPPKMLISVMPCMCAETIVNAAATGNMPFLKGLQQMGLAFGDPVCKLFYNHVAAGAASGGEIAVLEWMQQLAVESKCQMSRHGYGIMIQAVAHDQVSPLKWYGENVLDKTGQADYHSNLVEFATQKAAMKVLRWLESFEIEIPQRDFSRLIENTISRGDIRPLEWLQKMGVTFVNAFDTHHALKSLAHATCKKDYTKAALRWIESMGATAAHAEHHNPYHWGKGVLTNAVAKMNTVVVAWLAARLPEESFADIKLTGVWARCPERKILLLILSARRRRIRALPRELWEYGVMPWLD